MLLLRSMSHKIETTKCLIVLVPTEKAKKCIMPPHESLRISTPKEDACIYCGCDGEFKNEESGVYYVVSRVPRHAFESGFFSSDRACYCASCVNGCENSLMRKLRGLYAAVRRIGISRV